MPLVRLSGKVAGSSDPKRKERAEILYHLFSSGWDIYNANGDQTIKLSNIQNRILKSDAFVFCQNPSIEDYFNFASIFVGLQTNDTDLKDKPVILVNGDESWNSFMALIDHLIALGTIRQEYKQLFKVVEGSKQLVLTIDANYKEKTKLKKDEPDFIEVKGLYKENSPHNIPKRSVCVFCSASIRDTEYLDEGYEVGKILAKNGIGCISGAGKTGIMGKVVQGAYENGGWSAGSNVPHIIKMEGLPDGLNEFWPRANIYTRMEVMIERSDAFLIMPGGMGTIQELLALILLKEQNNDLVKDKKIVIYNKKDAKTNKHFWEPLIQIINSNQLEKYVEITSDISHAIDVVSNVAL
ncbi:MAG TPA: TIGR00730 family Rossman fold protein [Alphaproteobacteria bacterium]|nr:TIGR00730 family Rossman fold protein [Alphaproteobacteria bacterium]